MATSAQDLERKRRVRLQQPETPPLPDETDEMGDPVYKPKDEKRTEQLNARITKTIKSGLSDLGRIWSKFDQVEQGDDEIEWSEGDVVNRLLEHALAAAWTEIGFRPKSKEEWDEVLSRAGKVKLASSAPVVPDKKK